MQKAERDPPILLRQDLRGHGHSHGLVSGGQYDFVALDTERSIEDDRLSIQVVAVRILIGLDDHHAALATFRDRPRERHSDVVGRRIRIRHQAVFACLHTADHLKVQWGSEHCVVDAFVTGRTTLANGVIKELRPRSRCGHLVVNPEAGGLGSQQLIARIFVGLCLVYRRREIRPVVRCLRSLGTHRRANRQREANHDSNQLLHQPALTSLRSTDALRAPVILARGAGSRRLLCQRNSRFRVQGSSPSLQPVESVR